MWLFVSPRCGKFSVILSLNMLPIALRYKFFLNPNNSVTPLKLSQCYHNLSSFLLFFLLQMNIFKYLVLELIKAFHSIYSAIDGFFYVFNFAVIFKREHFRFLKLPSLLNFCFMALIICWYFLQAPSFFEKKIKNYFKFSKSFSHCPYNIFIFWYLVWSIRWYYGLLKALDSCWHATSFRHGRIMHFCDPNLPSLCLQLQKFEVASLFFLCIWSLPCSAQKKMRGSKLL